MAHRLFNVGQGTFPPILGAVLGFALLGLNLFTLNQLHKTKVDIHTQAMYTETQFKGRIDKAGDHIAELLTKIQELDATSTTQTKALISCQSEMNKIKEQVRYLDSSFAMVKEASSSTKDLDEDRATSLAAALTANEAQSKINLINQRLDENLRDIKSRMDGLESRYTTLEKQVNDIQAQQPNGKVKASSTTSTTSSSNNSKSGKTQADTDDVTFTSGTAASSSTRKTGTSKSTSSTTNTGSSSSSSTGSTSSSSGKRNGSGSIPSIVTKVSSKRKGSTTAAKDGNAKSAKAVSQVDVLGFPESDTMAANTAAKLQDIVDQVDTTAPIVSTNADATSSTDSRAISLASDTSSVLSVGGRVGSMNDQGVDTSTSSDISSTSDAASASTTSASDSTTVVSSQTQRSSSSESALADADDLLGNDRTAIVVPEVTDLTVSSSDRATDLTETVTSSTSFKPSKISTTIDADTADPDTSTSSRITTTGGASGTFDSVDVLPAVDVLPDTLARTTHASQTKTTRTTSRTASLLTGRQQTAQETQQLAAELGRKGAFHGNLQ